MNYQKLYQPNNYIMPIIISIIKYMFVLTVILASSLVLVVFLSDDLPQASRSKRQSHNFSEADKDSIQKIVSSPTYFKNQKITFDDILTHHNNTFNISGQDLLVLLHIQKTGGTTFERHLVHDLNIEKPCSCGEDKRRCFCYKPNREIDAKSIPENTWLVSRFSTGWICGLHADWTHLSNCLRNFHRLFFITFLRHPLHRFISEFRHVQRGATWKASRTHCLDQNTLQKACYGNRSNWSNVSLEEFLECPNNMAINRQTQMLADHNMVKCNSSSNLYHDNLFHSRDNALLLSAMNNLKNLAFFGLCEQQRASQIVFERTFNLTFKEEFKQSEDNKTKSLIYELSADTKERILQLNYLDVKLYKFATNLFEQRCKRLKCNT